MLPPGHIAGGYLAAKAVLKTVHYNFTSVQQRSLIFWGMLFSFIPDLDTFVVFGRLKAWIITDSKANHRKFLSHVPLLWLVAGLAIFFFSRNPYYKTIGMLLWICSWSHFVLDSIEVGIKWLWPFSSKLYSLFPGKMFESQSKGFIKYWLEFLKFYSTTPTFYAEIILIIITIIYATTAGYR